MWTFQQSSGKITAPDGTIAGLAYAGGNCGNNPEGINNPALQAASCVGPLPYGPKADGTPNMYTMGEPENHPKLGLFAIPLIPDADNSMFGRCSFFWHGDNPKLNQSASEGCIVSARNMRESAWNSGDHRMQVVA
jgi:hypothetical protein